MDRIKIDILPNLYLKKNGTFDKDYALKYCGKIAGVCYSKDGFDTIDKEPEEKTMKRINMTLDNGHHSVYDHVSITFNIHNIPKILSMVLNNEKQYTTSEKSARYTKIIRDDNSIITSEEELLYNKWTEILKTKIKERYGNIYSDLQITKLARENARYFITVFMPTEMVYTTTLRQINNISAFMDRYIENCGNTDFELRLSNSMAQFINELERLNVLEDKLMINEKNRKLSLFNNASPEFIEYFGNVYTTNYTASYAYLAQAQRHRSLNYQMSIMNNKEYFIPPIIEDDIMLVEEWIMDMDKVSKVTPQGELISIYESGTYENFILKCKERLCSHAQLEINNQTRKILQKYKTFLEDINHPLKYDIINYLYGARCTFKDYRCLNDCKNIEGKQLKRKI